MGAADGSINGTQKIVDHGPNAQRYNIVILGDGYRAAELNKYHADVQDFVDVLLHVKMMIAEGFGRSNRKTVELQLLKEILGIADTAKNKRR